MPQDGYRPPSSTPPDPGLPTQPPDASLIGQVKQLFEDVIEWLELRFELAKAQIEHKVKSSINETLVSIKTRLKDQLMAQRAQLLKKYKKPIAIGLVLVYVLMLVPVFLLVTLALGLSLWLGDPFWGFLVVTVLLVLGVVALGLYLRRLKRTGTAPSLAQVAEEGLLDPVPMPDALPGKTEEEATEPKALKAYQDEQDAQEKEQADAAAAADPLPHREEAEPASDGNPDAQAPNPRNA